MAKETTPSQTDASDRGPGGVLGQVGEDGGEQAVVYMLLLKNNGMQYQAFRFTSLHVPNEAGRTRDEAK